MRLYYLFSFMGVMFIGFLSVSCVRDLPINPEVGGHIVVNCLLSHDSVQYLSLTQSVAINKSFVFREIQNAVAELWHENTLVGCFEKKGYDNWILEYKPIAGGKYKLVVKVFDKQDVIGYTIMPERNLILMNKSLDRFPDKHFVQYTANNPTWSFVISSRKEMKNLSYPNREGNLKSHLGTDHPLADRFNQYGNLLDILPMADTPAFDYYIRLNQSELFEDIYFRIQTSYNRNSFVIFRTASMEYDNYLKSSLQKMDVYTDKYDPGQWFDESRIYSNIENGLGIFAAYADRYYYYYDVDN